MGEKTVLLITVVFLASGCIEGQNTDPEGFEELKEKKDSATFRIDYSFTSEKDSANISYFNLEGREKYASSRDTPGGLFEDRTYLLNESAVTCSEEPSPQGRRTHCKDALSDRSYRMLQLDKINLQQVNYTGKDSFNGRKCEKYSASLGEEREALRRGESIEICLDTEEGFISSLNITQGDRILSRFRAENVSDTVDRSEIELERPVGIFPHCTDSFEVDITTFKELDKAKISINGFNKTVNLPEQFETGVYSIPEENIEQGDNKLEIQVGGGVIEKSCYRRPS